MTTRYTQLGLSGYVDNPSDEVYVGWALATVPHEEVELLGDFYSFVHMALDRPFQPGMRGANRDKFLELWLYGVWVPGVTETTIFGYEKEDGPGWRSLPDSTGGLWPHKFPTPPLVLMAGAWADEQELVVANQPVLLEGQCSKAAQVWSMSGIRDGWLISYVVEVLWGSPLARFSGLLSWSDPTTVSKSRTIPGDGRVHIKFDVGTSASQHFDQAYGSPHLSYQTPNRVAADGGGFPFSGYVEVGRDRAASGSRRTVSALLYDDTGRWVWSGHLPGPGRFAPRDITSWNHRNWQPTPRLRYDEAQQLGQSMRSAQSGGRAIFQFPCREVVLMQPGMLAALRLGAHSECFRDVHRHDEKGTKFQADQTDPDALKIYNHEAWDWGSWYFGKSPRSSALRDIGWSSHDIAHYAEDQVAIHFIATGDDASGEILRANAEFDLRAVTYFGQVRGVGRQLKALPLAADCLPDMADDLEAKAVAFLRDVERYLRNRSGRGLVAEPEPGAIEPLKVDGRYNVNELTHNPHALSYAPWQDAIVAGEGYLSVLRKWGKIGPDLCWDASFQQARAVLLEGYFEDPHSAAMGVVLWKSTYAVAYDEGRHIMADPALAISRGEASESSFSIFQAMLPALVFLLEMVRDHGYVLVEQERAKLVAILREHVYREDAESVRVLRTLISPSQVEEFAADSQS